MQRQSVQRQQTVGQILRIPLQPIGNGKEVLARVQPVAGRVLADGARVIAHAGLIIVVVGRGHGIGVSLLCRRLQELEQESLEK